MGERYSKQDFIRSAVRAMKKKKIPFFAGGMMDKFVDYVAEEAVSLLNGQDVDAVFHYCPEFTRAFFTSPCSFRADMFKSADGRISIHVEYSFTQTGETCDVRLAVSNGNGTESYTGTRKSGYPGGLKKVRTDGGIGTYEQKGVQHTDDSVYEAKVEIDSATIKRIVDGLCGELNDNDALIRWTNGDNVTVLIPFKNGNTMHLTCHNKCRLEQEMYEGNKGPWTEAVLLNSDYEEMGYACSNDSFFGTWEITGTDCSTYRAEVVLKA